MTTNEQFDTEAKMPGTTTRLMLSLVTVLYAILSLAFYYPRVQAALMPVQTVWNFLGLQQKWNLFAPVIPRSTVHLIGIITLADGTKVLFAPPHPSNQPMLERFRYNRYLKWEADQAPFTLYRPYLPQLCKHILGEFSFPGSEPRSCALIMEMSPIASPDKKITPRDETPERWVHFPVYSQDNSEGGSR